MIKALRLLSLALFLSLPVVCFAQDDAATVASVAAADEAKADHATAAVAESEVSVLAAAVKASGSDTAPPIGWVAWLLAALTLAVTLATKFNFVIPEGYRTYAAIGVGVLTQFISSVQEMSAEGQALTSGAVLLALVSAALNRRKTGVPSP